MRRLLALLAVPLALLLAAPAALAGPVATSDEEYTVLGRVFPDPLGGCQILGTSPCDPNAQGNIKAQTFIGINEFHDGVEYMNTKEDWQRYMEVLILDGKYGEGSLTKAEVEADPALMFPGNNLAKLEWDPKPEYQSAGIPTTDLGRQKSDLTVVRVTDETVPDADKKRITLSLSIHGIERAGAEGGTRAMEDLVTAFTAERADQPVVAPEVREGAPTFADVLKSTVIYFTYPNPDGWRRGTIDLGGVGPDFQRYNGNGVDPNRDYTDIGYNFRGYSGGSEPETRAFKGFYGDMLASGTRFQAGDDLHGQPFADALSYTLMPHGRHDLGKDTRIRESAKLINRAQYESTKWSPIIKENEEVSTPQENCVEGLGAACPQIYAQTWGSVYDTINYTTTGTLGDWFDSTEGLNADGIDNEMSFSHLDRHIIFESNGEQLHVAGNKAIIYAHITDLLAPVTGQMKAPGRQGYVPNTRLKRAATTAPTGPPPNTVSQEDVEGAMATPMPAEQFRSVYEFKVDRTAPKGGEPGIFNGGLRVDATTPNFQGVGPGAATLEVQCLHCDDHVGAEDAAQDEWVTVAEDYNQSPAYAQAGITAAVNRPDSTYVDEDGKVQPVEWRAVVSVAGAGPVGPARIDIDFTPTPATDDGSSGGDEPVRVKGYDVANTDFFEDLNKFIPDASQRFEKIDPKKVIAGSQRLADFENVVLADELLPGYTGALDGVPPIPTGPPTANQTFEASGTAVPSQGAEECERTEESTDIFDYTVGANDGNRAMTVEITWLLENSDYDLHLQRKNQADEYEDITSSASFLTVSESVTVNRPPAGDYRVVVVNCTANPTDPFQGTVTFVKADKQPANRYTATEKETWVSKLKQYASGGGNLVLTDGALLGLQELTSIKADNVNRQTVYTGQITLTRCVTYDEEGLCDEEEQTLDDPLNKNVNQFGSRFNSGFRRQVFEPTPLGYAIQSPTGADQSNARQYDVDSKAFTDAGGRVANTSADAGERDAGPLTNRVTVGELPVGSGRIRLAGALLPQPSQDFDHPLGIEPYALTYTGYILLCNLLDAQCDVTRQSGGGGGGDGDGDGDGGGGGGGPRPPVDTTPPGGIDPPGGDDPFAQCRQSGGISSASVRGSGRGVRIDFDRRTKKPVTVDVFRVSQGRRVVRERLVARFTNREESFTWNGVSNREGRPKRVGSGYYFVRYTMRDGNRKLDVRRLVLRRANGRFTARPDYFRRDRCDLLYKFKLARPVFGGSRKVPLKGSYQLAAPGRVTVTIRKGSKVVKRYTTQPRQPRRTYRFTLPAAKRARGDYQVRLEAEGIGMRVTSVMTSRRL